MRMTRLTRALGLALVAALSAVSGRVSAQVTTGAITGTVTDEQGQPVEAAQIQMINKATGLTRGALTSASGRYVIQGLEVGAQYSVTARRIGFRPTTVDNVVVSLGQTTRADIKIERQATQLEAVTVVSETNAIISPTRTGASTTVGDSALRRLPSLNRNFTDFVALTPQVSNSGPGLSGGGSNNRFNNIQIDGAVSSDLFGLGSTGQPGGRRGQVDLDRGGEGVPGVALPVRRAPGELLRCADQCGDQGRDQRVPWFGVRRDAQPGLHAQPAVPHGLQAVAVRLCRRRPDREEQGALLPEPGIPAAHRSCGRPVHRELGDVVVQRVAGAGGPLQCGAQQVRDPVGVRGSGEQRQPAHQRLCPPRLQPDRQHVAGAAPQLCAGRGQRVQPLDVDVQPRQQRLLLHVEVALDGGTAAHELRQRRLQRAARQPQQHPRPPQAEHQLRADRGEHAGRPAGGRRRAFVAPQ
ncbi:MAG: carboxypeptidase regulatory-like domain-containing protein [Gemmatimonadetes bacterium]|nr:carboxypeptidase regulatory-like domain-containing protein [Gemmatimonadota bacterium]